MRKSLFMVLLLLALIFPTPLLAQTSDCDAQDVNNRVDALIENYQTARDAANDQAGALEAAAGLRDDIDSLMATCAEVTSETTTESTQLEPGTGVRQDPYTFGMMGDTGQGVSIQLTGHIRPANTIILSENMFNDRPEADEVYIILNLAVSCGKSTDRCEVNQFNFQLVGDRGIIYDVPSVVYDDMLDVNVLGGTDSQGNLPFIIKSDDTNLRLIYEPNMFLAEGWVYYAAEPSLANGVQITSSASINVRSGPGTNFAVAGNLPASTPTIAFGRTADGTWLQITQGWVFSELVTTDGDINSLPVTSQ